MLRSFSNKAIATKARAMYGGRITHSDYEELMKKRSVGDAAAYLRDNTHYREVLGQIDPGSIHRGQLEHLLRSLRYIHYQRLIAYDFGQQRLYHYIYRWDELQQLTALLRYLSGRGQGQAEGQYDFHYDRRLAGHTSYSFTGLVQVKSYRELVDFLGDSPYGRILGRFPPDSSGQIDLTGCEQALSAYYYNTQLSVVNKELRGEARAALKERFYQRIDEENLTQAYRLKRFFHSDPQYIRQSLLPFPTRSKKLIDAVIDAPGLGEVHAALRRAGLIAEGEEQEGDVIERAMLRQRARESKRDLRNSGCPPVVLRAYMTQLHIEQNNIVNIIESVRYGLPAEEMRGMLIL